MNYCRCLQPVSLKDGITQLKDEFIEFLEEPSLDEISDCTYALGRLCAGMFGKVYFSMPLDGRHITKIQKRMEEHGCIRSKRHLVDGKCPS